MGRLYMVDVFDRVEDDTACLAVIYADKENIKKLVAQKLSLCIIYGDRFLDVCKGEYMNPIDEWFI